MTQRQGEYIAALRYDWLTSFYDPIMRWTMREGTFKHSLVQQARIEHEHDVLDLGCGTATLTLIIKETHPTANVTGVDGDAKVLSIAGKKASRHGMSLQLDQENATQLTYLDHTFDRVLSSLLLHHLTLEDKKRALSEVFRVLRPGGELHIADWGKARNWWMRLAFYLVQMLDGFETTKDNVNGAIPLLMAQAGYVDVQQTTQYSTVFGTLSLYQARKPI